MMAIVTVTAQVSVQLPVHLFFKTMLVPTSMYDEEIGKIIEFSVVDLVGVAILNV